MPGSKRPPRLHRRCPSGRPSLLLRVQMLVFTCFIFPLIFASIPSFSSGGGMAAGEAIETLIALGPFLHCLLMPFTWVRTHRRNAKVAAEDAKLRALYAAQS